MHRRNHGIRNADCLFSSMKALRRRYPAFMIGCGLIVACAQSAEQRRSRVHELQANPSEDNLQKIRTMLDDPDRDVRAAALNALAQQGVRDALAIVSGRLADPEAIVRATAVMLLGELGNEQHESVVGRLLAEDPDPLVRQRAAEALVVLGGENALEGLMRGLEDPTERVRLASVEGVRKLGPAPAKAVLTRLLLEDSEWEIRAGAAQALGESGDADVPAALEAALADENEYVRAAAARALRVHEKTRATTAQPAGS